MIKARGAILYGGRIFACRHCHDLAYPSQRESDFDRLGRRAEKLRVRLKWEPGILNWAGERPNGMHHRTYYRLMALHDAYAGASLLGRNGDRAVAGAAGGAEKGLAGDATQRSVTTLKFAWVHFPQRLF